MNYYNEIKQELINNKIYNKIKDYSKNKNSIETYYKVGKLIIEAQGGETRAKYGNDLIKIYAEKLKIDVGKEYNERTLRRIRQFYITFKNWSTVSTKLTWSHYCELLTIKDMQSILYYKNKVEKESLSIRELRNIIKSKEYERISEDTKEKILKKDNISEISDFIKHPIIIHATDNSKDLSEKILKQLILEDLDNFLKELGNGFLYAGNEYKIKIGDRYYYIDILLYNIEFRCYVVVELKITELKAEHIGQIQKYINYIDKHIKKATEEDTIGIIICKKENKFILEYCSNPRIFETTYKVKNI
ncbi:MAG: DUF1016 family protein [Bacilli bacterium]|nr:DUF1016 family protein [Bacilli bacterium]